MAKITIIGSGAMASACGKVLFNNNHEVIIYGVNQQELKELSMGMNLKFFSKQTKIPKFNTTGDLKLALDKTDYVLLAVPSKFMNEVYSQIITNLNSDVILINVAKGFYPGTTLPLHSALEKMTEDNPKIKGVVSLIGPSHAEEIIKDCITLVCSVSHDLELAQNVQSLFSNSYFRVYSQTDVIGAEIGSIFKNILAIANGILDAKNYGINTKAALISRGISEMKKYTLYSGGKLETLLGLTGIGDLIVTAFSRYSRNFNFGYDFGKNGIKAFETSMTVEGLTALKDVYENVVSKKVIELPIIEALYKVVYKNRNFDKMLSKLLTRELKSE